MNNWIRISLRHCALLVLFAWPLAGVAQEPSPVEQAPAADVAAASETLAPAEALPQPESAKPVEAPKPAKRNKPAARVGAADKAAKVETAAPAEIAPAVESAADTDSEDGEPDDSDSDHKHSQLQSIVSVGHDSKLEGGEKAEVVVSVFGSSTSDGEVSDAVVSILGDTRVTGPVGDAAVAVFGDLHLNSKIGGDAVVVFGDMDLGPNAEVGGETVVVGGTLKRAASTITHGGVEQILGGHFGMQWLRPWVKHCMLLARPLAIAPGLGWAWGLALGFLALYVLFALMFRGAIDQCIETFEAQPGRTLLASLLSLLLSPVLIVLLAATVIGVVLIPFLGIALLCAGLFGKAVVLALIGKRLTRPFGNEMLAHPAIGVIIGGVLMLALYMVPVVGFIVYKLLGILGLGVVVYTLILVSRSTESAPAAQSAAASPEASVGSASTAGFDSAAAAPAGAAVPRFDAPGAGASFERTPPPAAESVLMDVATLPRAGFWARMGALFIDVVLIAVSVSLLHDMDGMWLLVLAIYGAVMWKLKGTTIGGIVLSLKVARLDGRPIDWATSIVRALSCFLSLVLVGLGFIWIIFDEEKQAWHDKIAGTVVVRVPKGVSLV